MAKEEGYQIVSQRDVRKLKQELKAMKEGKGGDVSELQDRLEDLTERIDAMIEIFESAAAELREEDKEAEIISKKIDPIFARLDSMDEQNRKIAQGLVAINEIVEEKLSQITDTAQVLARAQEEFRAKLNLISDKIEGISSGTESMMNIPPPVMPGPIAPATGAPLPPPPGPPSSGPSRFGGSTEIPKLKPRKKHFLF
ncbi:hypothetical protein KY335_02585 [Candidatus Woesearchaeota archaeon]|nr:hypothetical protein [Candidatus Woesearchaeota archaeon]